MLHNSYLARYGRRTFMSARQVGLTMGHAKRPKTLGVGVSIGAATPSCFFDLISACTSSHTTRIFHHAVSTHQNMQSLSPLIRLVRHTAPGRYRAFEVKHVTSGGQDTLPLAHAPSGRNYFMHDQDPFRLDQQVGMRPPGHACNDLPAALCDLKNLAGCCFTISAHTCRCPVCFWVSLGTAAGRGALE
ncbi:hypothetical protein BDZ85DRAFT_113280 [Elsinoe ampelina]|uniref:Uncharacterized protein n=1 Tax=Elsinoe ampelina TaxID=302913 RepID=A0A6A6GDX8_9PEZI|nr:hypothetical protein BDZ85DRAFT_113280 [Elsinoe ampelina]